MNRFARHTETGEPNPKSRLEKLLAARKFNQGFVMAEYTVSAMFDLDIHEAGSPGALDTAEFEQELRARIGMPEAIALSAHWHSVTYIAGGTITRVNAMAHGLTEELDLHRPSFSWPLWAALRSVIRTGSSGTQVVEFTFSATVPESSSQCASTTRRPSGRSLSILTSLSPKLIWTGAWSWRQGASTIS